MNIFNTFGDRKSDFVEQASPRKLSFSWNGKKNIKDFFNDFNRASILTWALDLVSHFIANFKRTLYAFFIYDTVFLIFLWIECYKSQAL